MSTKSGNKTKTSGKTTTFDKVSKEVNDLFHLDISRLKDPKVRKKLFLRSIPYVIFGYVGNLFRIHIMRALLPEKWSDSWTHSVRSEGLSRIPIHHLG